jgi:LuxR family quorum sensing-dependent transcriptional regulator
MSSARLSAEPQDAATFNALRDSAIQLQNELSCDYFSYGAIRTPGSTAASPCFIVTSYPDEWRRRYLTRNYLHYDPVATLSRRTRLPFYWGQKGFLDPYGKAARRVFHEAGEHRILEGYAIPTAGPEGDAGVFCMVVSQRRLIQELVRDQTPRLQLFAAQFHDAAIRLWSRSAKRPRPELSSRQKEVLCWAADGLSSEATAEKIGISASAVNFHLVNAARKLGAANKIQAVALAIRQSII